MLTQDGYISQHITLRDELRNYYPYLQRKMKGIRECSQSWEYVELEGTPSQ